MKKIIFSVLFLFLGLIFFRFIPGDALANPKCITFKVKVTAKSWPGGKLQIGCPGDRGPQCIGEIKDIRVGQANPVVLGKCSCFPGKNGCLTLGKKLKLGPLQNGKRKVQVVTPIPSKCELTNKKKFCGANGQTKKANFKLTCEKLPTPTPTPTGIPTPTPTPPICVGPKKVTNVKVTCPSCFGPSQSNPQTGDINWKIKDLFLSAKNPYVQIGNTKVEIKDKPTLSDSSAEIVKIGNTYRAELSGTWVAFSGIQSDDTSMLMSFIFSYTPGGFWKVTEITVSDGTRNDVFIKYGPTTKSGDTIQNSIGDYYINNGSATEFVSADGKNTLHFENLQIGAFLKGVSN